MVLPPSSPYVYTRLPEHTSNPNPITRADAVFVPGLQSFGTGLQNFANPALKSGDKTDRNGHNKAFRMTNYAIAI